MIFTLRLQSHSRFKRIGDNLYHDCQIDLKQALLGFKTSVKHLDSHYTEISSKDIVQPYSVKVIKGEGMPIHSDIGSFGDMHVKFIVKLPKKLTEKDRELLKKIFELPSS